MKAEVLCERALMAGDLDISFDGDGKVRTDFATPEFGGALERAHSVAIQSDGKIVVAGRSFTGNGEQYNFALARYNSDGSLDTSFDSDGKVTTDFGGGDDYSYSVAIQSDGKIVVAGESYNGSKRFDFALARYNSNGSLDTTFDFDGKVTTDFGGSSDDRAHSIAIQSDAKIVVAGYSKGDFVLTRYNPNGSLDTSFDGDGKVTTVVGSSFFIHIPNSVAIQSDGKIVVAGFRTSGGRDFALTRYNSNGSLDTTFDGDGRVTTDFGNTTDDVAHSVAIQTDGKLVVAGFSGTPGIFDSDDFALTRYNTDGSLDTSFDGDGKVTTDFGRNLNDHAYSVAIQSDGKILVAGESKHVRGGYDFALARYNTNGNLDTSFDGDGMITTTVGSHNFGQTYGALSVAIQSDGKIVVAGDGPDDFALARYNASDAPTDITLSLTSIMENAPANTTVGTLTTVDPDGGDAFIYTFVPGTGSVDNASFNISGNSLRATSGFDFETKSSYSIRIRSTDQGGLFTERTFTITVININELPTNISLSSSTIAENAAANTPVGTMSTADPDAGNSFTYTLVAGSGDADNAAFDIAGSLLRASNTFNFEIKSSYTVRVRTTDQGGLFTEKMFTITVTNVNEPPMDIALSSTSIPENVGANAVVGTLSTADPDAGNTFTYFLVAGTGSTDNGAFNISGNTLRATSSLDIETKNSYTVRIRTIDQGGLFFEKAFTITVTEANEAPADIALSSTSIAENSPANTNVGTMSTIDPNAGDTFTYTLVSGTGSTDNGAFNIIGSTLRATYSLDFEAKNSYNVRIRTTDRGGLSIEKTFTIAVTNMVVGDLDNTFDGDGKVTTDFVNSDDYAFAVAIQSDGKVVVAGMSFYSSLWDFALARYTFDGRLDGTFDGDGKVTTAVGSSADAALSVAIQSDGKIVVAGYSDNGSNYDFALARYNSNGSLDTTFDGDGKVTTDFGNSGDVVHSVAIQSDGKIVVAGYRWNGSNGDFALARYNSNGTLDATFDGDGKVTTDFGNSEDAARSVAIQSDGKIVVAGTIANGSNSDFALARYNSDGSLDTSFDGDGKVTTDFGNSGDEVHSVAMQSDGRIVVAGSSWDGNNLDFAFTRYNANGSLDTTFDGDGKVTTDFGNSEDEARSIAIQSDGKIVVAGRSWDGSDWDIALTRYNSNGSLDTTFAFDGMVTTAVGNSADGAYSVAIQSDGKIVAAGYSDNGSNRDFALTRYNVDFNQNPTDISLSSTSIAENAGINATVGTFSTADPDASNSFTYTLVAGAGDADNAAFNIAGSILRTTNSFNFEAKSIYSIRVRSTDQGGLFTEKAFTITVTNVNETPTDISLSSSSIVENAGANAVVGTLSTADPDSGNSFTYALVAGSGDTDNAWFNISANSLRATSSFDLETKSSYTVRVRSTDQNGLFVEKTFAIQIVNLNEMPSDISLTSATVLENSGPNAMVGTLATADVDVDNTFVYSLVAGSGDTDNAAFNVSGSKLRATSSLDFETRSDYTVRIRSTDQGGLFVEKVFAIRVLNANDAPIAVADSYWISVDTVRTLDVLVNDSDVDSAIDPTSIEIFSPPSHGAASPMPDGTVRYTPNTGYRGADSFTYRVRDSLGLSSNPAAVQLRVNSAPNTAPDSLVVKQTVTTVLDVLRNDSDPDGMLDPASLVIVSGSEMADMMVQNDGTIRFTPKAGFLGTTQFRYVVSDNESRPSVPTDVTVRVVVSIYQNPRSRFDVDDDGTASPLDVLVLINLLNTLAPSLPVDGLPGPPAYVDVNADNRVDPLDVLEVINHINSRGNGEGEGNADRIFYDVLASYDWHEELRKSNRLRLTKF